MGLKVESTVELNSKHHTTPAKTITKIFKKVANMKQCTTCDHYWVRKGLEECTNPEQRMYDEQYPIDTMVACDYHTDYEEVDLPLTDREIAYNFKFIDDETTDN